MASLFNEEVDYREADADLLSPGQLPSFEQLFEGHSIPSAQSWADMEDDPIDSSESTYHSYLATIEDEDQLEEEPAETTIPLPPSPSPTFVPPEQTLVPVQPAKDLDPAKQRAERSKSDLESSYAKTTKDGSPARMERDILAPTHALQPLAKTVTTRFCHECGGIHSTELCAWVDSLIKCGKIVRAAPTRSGEHAYSFDLIRTDKTTSISLIQYELEHKGPFACRREVYEHSLRKYPLAGSKKVAAWDQWPCHKGRGYRLEPDEVVPKTDRLYKGMPKDRKDRTPKENTISAYGDQHRQTYSGIAERELYTPLPRRSLASRITAREPPAFRCERAMTGKRLLPTDPYPQLDPFKPPVTGATPLYVVGKTPGHFVLKDADGNKFWLPSGALDAWSTR